MNIFITSLNPVKSANALDDKRINKMITEGCQMLSTCAYMLNPNLQSLFPLHKFRGNDYQKQRYRDTIGLMIPCYVNHPCNIWIRKCAANFTWLVDHLYAMRRNYINYSHKQHQAMRILQSNYFPYYLVGSYSTHDLSPLPNCTPYCSTIGLNNKNPKKHYFVDSNDKVVRDYKKFMLKKWYLTDKRPPIWRGRDLPDFVSDKTLTLMRKRREGDYA